MRVALQVQGAEVVQRGRGRLRVDIALPDVASQRLCDLDVREVRNVQAFHRVNDTRGDELAGRRGQNELDERRGIEHDHRASRSARITVAA